MFEEPTDFSRTLPERALAVIIARMPIFPRLVWCLSIIPLLAASSVFADPALTKEQAKQLADQLWADHVTKVKAEHATLLTDDAITVNGVTMKFKHKFVGEKPKDGWDLWINMHGGGGAPPEVNDQQWDNQIKLYSPDHSLVISPRAPTDSWNMWHQAPIDDLYDALISDLVALGEVNPNRVYLIGYSAGGDGVYQLAPRMADRLAGAGMMAGHPNETSPLGLRNIGFALHVGALDDAYNRNGIAAQWKQMLADLHRADPDGYKNQVQLHEGRAHWMNHEENSALPFLQSFTRDPLPKKVVWKQDDVTHDRFYWLSVPKEEAKQGTLIIARREGQTIDIDAAEGVSTVTILLNDDMADLDQSICVRVGGVAKFYNRVTRSAELIRQSFGGRGDRSLVFCASITLDIPSNSVEDNTAATLMRWTKDVPPEIVSAFVLPSTSIDEKREAWRITLTPIAKDITKDSKTIPEAAFALNRDLFKRVNVQYHPTKRPKPNQSPSESIEAGFASCTGLSILLVDACRSIGIPARLVGTPNWITHKGDANGNHGGNHTWVEIWDGSSWRYLGASEPSEFDQTWFNDNASKADSNVFENGIYTAAYVRDSALYFPMVWSPENQSVPGIDVTDYYAHRTQVSFALPEKSTATIRDNGRLVGLVKGPSTTIPLAGGRLYTAEIVDADGKKQSTQFTLNLEAKQDVALHVDK